MKVPNYKILAFEKNLGIVTIAYEGYQPLTHEVPTLDGKYLSGDEFDLWVRLIFSRVAIDHYGIPRPDYANTPNHEYITSIVDGTPYETPVKELSMYGQEDQPVVTGMVEL